MLGFSPPRDFAQVAFYLFSLVLVGHRFDLRIRYLLGLSCALSVCPKVPKIAGVTRGDLAIMTSSVARFHARAILLVGGHISQPGGVLERGGHTEAAIDLAKLAGLSPVGVLCEITTKDGKDMARYVFEDAERS